MAEEDQDRSEAATPFKLQEARKKGSVPKSLDVNGFFVLLAGVSVLHFLGSTVAGREMQLFRGIFASAHKTKLDSDAWVGLLVSLMGDALGLLAPLFAAVLILGVLTNFFQTGPVFSLHPVKPDLERINPVAGFKRLFSMKLIVESVKTVLKFGLLGTVLYFAVKAALPTLLKSVNAAPKVLGQVFLPEATAVLLKMLVALAVVALIDWTYSRWDFARRMRMSHRDIKDEHKRREGDPRVKSRIRELQREARKRSQSLGRVKDADVLITNPVHLAIAIKYDKVRYDAPIIIAKGAGGLARKMRRVGHKHRVPIIENRLLARALFRQVRIDEAVPTEHFGVMAKILVWAYTMRRQSGVGGAR